MGLFGKLLDRIAFWVLARSSAQTLIPQNSGASEQLKTDVLKFIRSGLQRAGDARGLQASVVDTEILQVSPHEGWSQERWYVQCGGRVFTYDIRFDSDGSGGTNFDIQLPPTRNPPVPAIPVREPMRLSSEKLGDLINVAAADVERVFYDNSFGQFVILSISEESFIQAASDATSFDRQHDYDPWVLEYRDGSTAKQFRARGDLSIEQVRQAFLSYLRGGDEWHRDFAWAELEL